jgi:hypothetical protein
LSSSIDQKRIDMLNTIGFTWDAQEASWEKQMDELRTFREKYGTCDISRSDKDHRKLYRWIREQKRIYRDKNAAGQPGGLSEKRLSELKSVGFTFDSVSATFSSRLAELTTFHQEHNHCEVKPENHELYQWIQWVRKQHDLKLNGKEHMLQERHIQSLNKMEFSWKVYDEDSTNNHNDTGSCLMSTTSSSNCASSTSSLESERSSKNTRPLKKRRIG